MILVPTQKSKFRGVAASASRARGSETESSPEVWPHFLVLALQLYFSSENLPLSAAQWFSRAPGVLPGSYKPEE